MDPELHYDSACEDIDPVCTELFWRKIKKYICIFYHSTFQVVEILPDVR